MPAYLYERSTKGGKSFLNQVRGISLAGYNAIYNIWISNGKPVGKGWHIRADEIIGYAIGAKGNIADHKIIIDAAPSVKNLVDLVELIDIHVYTHSNDTGGASWSNLMLRVKDICWKESVTPAEKTNLTKSFEPTASQEDILTFLYLHGDNSGWKPGRIGQMNGAFIHSPARKYFRDYF